MAERQGDIIWYELMTTDQDAAGRFYAEVLGWTVDQSSNAPDGYRMISGPGSGKPLRKVDSRRERPAYSAGCSRAYRIGGIPT